MKLAFFRLRSRPSGNMLPVWLAVVLCLGFGAAAPANAQQAPTITVQPASQYVSAGSVVCFRVTAVGDEPLNYQWFKDGVELVDGRKVSGSASPVLTLSDVQGGDMGSYSAWASNQSGSAASTQATLHLTPLVAWGGGAVETVTNVPPGLDHVMAIASGPFHNLALRGDGTVAAWGSDYSYYGYTNVPSGLSNVVAVAAGGYHSLALRADGSAVGWGYDYYGQATAPADLTNAVAIAAGGSFSVALRSDGGVVAWGRNQFGQATVPEGLRNVISVGAGSSYSVALRSDGTVASWGAIDIRGTPASVPEGLSNVVAVSAGLDHCLAVRSDGTVVAWGVDNHGLTNVPPGLNGVVAVAAGGNHNLALRQDGTVMAWSAGGGVPPSVAD